MNIEEEKIGFPDPHSVFSGGGQGGGGAENFCEFIKIQNIFRLHGILEFYCENFE
jgi:hypothetical protein